jgi:hypothetical protein
MTICLLIILLSHIKKPDLIIFIIPETFPKQKLYKDNQKSIF